MKRLYCSILALGLLFAVSVAGFPQGAAAADSDADKAKAAITPEPAKEPPVPAIDKIPILKLFSDQGVSITYIGRKYNLDGWLIVKGEALQVIYTTLDGQGAVLGTLFAPDGTLETKRQLLAAKEKGTLPSKVVESPSAATVTPVQPAPAAPANISTPVAPGATEAAPVSSPRFGEELPSERLWKQVEASKYLKFGSDTAPPFYVVMDPRCEYCHKLYGDITAKYLANNAMQMRVIPVGILGPDSDKQAVEILSSPDGAKLWDGVEHTNVGDLAAVDPIQAGIDAKKRNEAILQEWHLTGTPAIIYRSKSGKVKVVLGAPEDMDAVVADLAPSPSH